MIFKSIPPKITSLYHITHIDNLESIFFHGICSRNFCEQNNLIKKEISNADIVNRRTKRIVKSNRTVTDFTNLYFQPINAMLFDVFNKHNKNDIIILEVHYNIYQPDIFFIDGNAAKMRDGEESHIFPSINFDQEFPKIEQYLKGDTYRVGEEKWKRMAECLIFEKISKDNIKAIHISESSTIRDRLTKFLEKNNLELPIIQNEKILGASF